MISFAKCTCTRKLSPAELNLRVLNTEFLNFYCVMRSYKVYSTILFQEFDRNCVHQACARSSGAVEIVKALLKVCGKESKLIPDNVCAVLECSLFWDTLSDDNIL